jgi:hypothetical protein
VVAGTVVGLAAIAVAAGGAMAGGSGGSDHKPLSLRTSLTGYQEDPLVLSTTGAGRFSARVNAAGTEITYRLRYSGTEGAVTQAHLHLGGRAQSGGISAFLCTNLGNGPAGTQACPAAPGTVEGTLDAADVIGPTGQGIAAGQFAELVRAVRAGVVYVNVHTSLYPGGEIRGQLDGHLHR